MKTSLGITLSVTLLGLAAATVMLLSGCSPVTILNAVIPTGDLTRTNDLQYGPLPQQVLDVYVPKAPAPTSAGYPVVVFFYGGSWQNGRRADYLFAAQALASKGFIAVLPDYRKYPQAAFPGFMEDAAAAVRFTLDHIAQYGGDPARLYLMGHSAGAHIAVLLATDSRYLEAAGVAPARIRAVVGLAGPYDFLPLTDPVLEQVFPVAVRRASQPINFVHAGAPPMFLAAGTKDQTVDPGNTDRMAARLRAAGDTVVEKHYAGMTHVSLIAALAAPLRGRKTVLNDVAAFLAAH